MQYYGSRTTCLVVSLLVGSLAAPASAQVGTEFSYQGAISDAGQPVNGPLDFRLTLWDDEVAGVQTGPTLDQAATAIEGLFSLDLDFGAAPFALDATLWLQVEVSGDGGGSYTTLDRQKLTAAPHSLSTRGMTVTENGIVGFNTTTPEMNSGRVIVDALGHGFSHVYFDEYYGTTNDITTYVDINAGYIGTVAPIPLAFYTGGTAVADIILSVDGDVSIGTGLETQQARLEVFDNSAAATAVRGRAFGTGTTFGVYGWSNSPNGWGVFSNGKIGATGTKSFVIDHPLDPANSMLVHYSSEAPEPLNTYSGTVILDSFGEATIALPDYFDAINADARYQLTPIGAAAPNLHVAAEVWNNEFAIAGGAPGLKVSWQVTARRDDAFVRLRGAPTEVRKDPEHRGRYLMPEAYGAPASMGMHGDAAEPSATMHRVREP